MRQLTYTQFESYSNQKSGVFYVKPLFVQGQWPRQLEDNHMKDYVVNTAENFVEVSNGHFTLVQFGNTQKMKWLHDNSHLSQKKKMKVPNIFESIYTKWTNDTFLELLLYTFIFLEKKSLSQPKCFILNSPGTIVCSTDNFPFRAKILTDIISVFTVTCYHFFKLISYWNSRQLVLVLWNVIRFFISLITRENPTK